MNDLTKDDELLDDDALLHDDDDDDLLLLGKKKPKGIPTDDLSGDDAPESLDALAEEEDELLPEDSFDDIDLM